MGLERAKVKKKKKLGSYPYASVLFSITLALFVIGLFGLLLVHTSKLKELIQSNVELQIYLDKDLTENEKIQIQKIISAKPFLSIKNNEPQITFISKEDAAAQFQNDTGEDIVDFIGENPLRDAYTINISPDYQDIEKLEEISSELENINGIYEVTYVENLIASINQNLTKVSLILISFSLILLLTVVILINNTIKLALFSQRFLIRSMQLVGATGTFIKKPFLFRATMHGFLSGLIASGFLTILIYYANQKIEDLNKLQEINQILILFASLIILGSVIGLFSTFRAINRYLRMSLDELY